MVEWRRGEGRRGRAAVGRSGMDGRTKDGPKKGSSDMGGTCSCSQRPARVWSRQGHFAPPISAAHNGFHDRQNISTNSPRESTEPTAPKWLPLGSCNAGCHPVQRYRPARKQETRSPAKSGTNARHADIARPGEHAVLGRNHVGGHDSCPAAARDRLRRKALLLTSARRILSTMVASGGLTHGTTID
jgi:hypothetical protein